MRKAFSTFELLFVIAVISILSGILLEIGSKTTSKAQTVNQSSPIIEDLKTAYSEVFFKAIENGGHFEHIDFETTEYNNKITMIDHCANGDDSGFQLIVEVDCESFEDTEACKESTEAKTIAYLDSCNESKIEIKQKEGE